MADYSNARPEDVWLKIRSGEITGQTSGMCNGYAQANLVIMPEKYAEHQSLPSSAPPQRKSCSQSGTRPYHPASKV